MLPNSPKIDYLRGAVHGALGPEATDGFSCFSN